MSAEICFIVFALITLTIIFAGVRNGIERVSKFMMPILVVLSVIIAIYSVTRPGALKGIQYPDSMAEAVKISCHGTEYVVIFCHQEVNSPTDLEEADGCMGYGNVIVFDKKKDVLAGTVLQY